MTAEPLPSSTCVSCGAPVASDSRRCPGCGLRYPAASGRTVLARTGVWVLASLLVLAWACALFVVAAAR